MNDPSDEAALPRDIRDIPGALGGSRLFARPEVAADLAALRMALGPGPTLLEIGFDHGRRLSATAAENPNWTVIGLEVRERQVDAMRAWATSHALANLFAFRLDARVILAGALPAESFDVIEALFPTPWPEGKARRRLLVAADFLADVARALRPGGLFHVATDVAWYAEHIERELGACPDLVRVEHESALTRRPPCSQRSRREWKCEREGLPVYRFTALRR